MCIRDSYYITAKFYRLFSVITGYSCNLLFLISKINIGTKKTPVSIINTDIITYPPIFALYANFPLRYSLAYGTHETQGYFSFF